MTSLAPLALLAAALLATPAAAAGLEAYRGVDRPVVVFAPDRRGSAVVEQLRRLDAAHAALAERDMPVFVVTRRDVTALTGGRTSAALTAAGLRAEYGVGDEAFTILLIGKDGGEKLRSAKPVSAEALIGLVDGMPMRKREAR